MESVDAFDGFGPGRLVLLFYPPSNEARPRATLEPFPALGKGLSVDAAISECGDRLEISPNAQRHRELVKSKVRRYARGRKHRTPRMLPGLHVPDGPCKESGATFGSRIDGRQSVHKTLHNAVANRLLQDPECEERDSSCHACTLASTVVVREHERREFLQEANRSVALPECIARDAQGLMPDPERAAIVRRLFKHYATGTYTKQEILQKATQWRLTNRRGQPLSSQAIGMLLRNRLYIGIIDVPEFGVRDQRGDFAPLINE